MAIDRDAKTAPKVVPFILLNGLSLLALFYAFVVYTSLFEWSPWYEPCGLQFLVIPFFVSPALFVAGTALVILGRFLRISVLNQVLPFGAALLLFVLIFNLTAGSMITGAGLSVAFAVITIMTTITSLLPGKKAATAG